MKSFALLFAVYWSVQAFICLPPEFGSGANRHDIEHQAATTEHRHEHSSAAVRADADPGREQSRDSDGAPSGHHQDSGGDCERHCASLDQTLASTPPTLSVPEVGDYGFSAIQTAELASARGLARKVDAFEIGLPPPDLLTIHSALRI